MSRSGMLVSTVLVLLALIACAPDAPTPIVPPSEVVSGPSAAPVASDAVTSPASADRERVTITFGLFEDERAVFEPLIAAFEDENPDIHVQLVMLDPIFAGGEPPDYERVVLSAADTTNFSMSQQAIANGWVRDLTPLMEADASFDRADFYPGVLEAASQSGRLYQLPRAFRVPVLLYNKDLWAAHRLPTPTADWTWTDLLGAAEQLADRRGTSSTYGLLDWFATGALTGQFATSGLYRDSADRRPLDDPAVVEAVERVHDLIASGAVLSIYGPAFPHDANHPDERRAADLIRNGQIGIWSPDLCCYDFGGQLPLFAVGVIPFPKPPFSNFTGMDSYVMSSGTAHPEAAWRWLAYLSRQTYAPPADFYNENTSVLARRSVVERSGYWQQQPLEYAAAIKAIVEGPRARDLIGARPLPIFFAVDFGSVFQAMLRDGTSAQSALHEAQQAREQQALQPSPTPNVRPIAVATPLPEAASGATRITFGATGSNDDGLRQVVAAFNQQESGVFVEIVQRDVSEEPPSPAVLAARTDCFASFVPPDADALAATLDLLPLAEADLAFDLDDYYPALLAPFQRAGALHALPHEVYPRVLMYNQSAFDAAGVANPSAAWSLDDLLLAARSLTQGEGEARRYGFAAPFSSWREVFFVLDRSGATVTRGDGVGIAPNFTDSKVRRAIQTYLELLRDNSPHQTLSDYASGPGPINNAGELIDVGRVAMWFSFGLDTRQTRGWQLAVAPPPGLQTVTARDVVASGLYISAQTQHRDACWQWLTFFSRDRTTLAGGFPARRSLVESRTAPALPAGAADVERAYRAALDRTTDVDDATDTSAIDFYWFIRAMDRALQGRDLERELDEAQRLTTNFLTCLRSGVSGNECAMQVDPTYRGWKNASPHRR
jgi:ABC-type glycerol-3-phosphate transport system substrate-binding protein